ncbi:hypothetical protein BJY52DRAFT_1229861, partial [Lactarius psammicola]
EELELRLLLEKGGGTKEDGGKGDDVRVAGGAKGESPCGVCTYGDSVDDAGDTSRFQNAVAVVRASKMEGDHHISPVVLVPSRFRQVGSRSGMCSGSRATSIASGSDECTENRHARNPFLNAPSSCATLRPIRRDLFAGMVGAPTRQRWLDKTGGVRFHLKLEDISYEVTSHKLARCVKCLLHKRLRNGRLDKQGTARLHRSQHHWRPKPKAQRRYVDNRGSGGSAAKKKYKLQDALLSATSDEC